jgi:hypothetical protein
MTSLATLIPAFKPAYLVDLLACLSTQSRPPDRIILSDDSPDGAFIALLRRPEIAAVTASLPIEVIQGPRTGPYANVRQLLDRWGGSTDLFHLLLDDDVIYPDFYRRHVMAHEMGEFLCSISRRWTATEDGMPVGEGRTPEAIEGHDGRLLTIDAAFAFSSTLPACNNWFGELSNAVLRPGMGDVLLARELAGVPTNGLEDLAAFLSASLTTPLAIVNDHLGFFRTSDQQHSAKVMSTLMKGSHLAWPALALTALRIGRLDEDEVAASLARMGPIILNRYRDEPDMAEPCRLVGEVLAGAPGAADRYLEMWNRFAART